MRRSILFSLLLVLTLSVLASNVHAQTPVLEILDEPSRVTEHEEFSFTVRLTNAQDYDYFSLSATGEEELTWGTHIFDGDAYIIYSHEYTISLSETGSYTIHVEAGSLFSGASELTESFTVYVEEEQSTTSISPFLGLLGIIALFVVIVSVVSQRKSADKKKLEETEDIPAYTRVLIVCPYCGKKFEQGLTQCPNCHANV